MNYQEKDEQLIVTFNDQLDTVVSLKLRPIIIEKAENSETDFVFELKNITYIDSGGINILLSVHRILHQKNKKLILRNITEPVQKILRLGNLEKILHIDTPNGL